MVPEESMGRDVAIDRFWDQVTQDRTDAPGDLDPADAATIRYLHAGDDRPVPSPGFRRQLREDLMHTPAIQVSSEPSLRPSVNGYATPPRRLSPRVLPPSARHGGLAHLATAALLLLVLVGSFFAFGPGRSRPQHQAPAIIPAVSGTPATPPGLTAPLAEVLWQADGGPDFVFGEPVGLAIGPDGNVWVADGENARFVIFSPEGEVLEAWGTPGSGEGEFDFTCASEPASGLRFGAVAFDGAGNIYVADAGNERIQKFAPDRTFLTSWASAGSADEPFGCPGAIAVDGQGQVYVGGEKWGKVEVFDDEGAWLATWPDLMNPAGITVDGDGNIWIADSGGQVVKFSADGERLSSWKGDVGYIEADGVAVDGQGRVFVTDFAHRVVVFTPDGTVLGEWGEFGDKPGEFWTPWGIALDGQGAVYISDPEVQRLQKFRLLPPLAPGAPSA